jgi:DNA-binding MarR family transcriptional regulator
MQRCADALFSRRKTTTDQCALLWVVRRREGIRQNELASELFTDANTVTAMVVRLEKRGLIHREVCADDGRARRVYLSPAGRRLVEKLSEDWEPVRRKLRELFAGPAGQEALRILEEVCTAMTRSREEFLEKRSTAQKRRRRATSARPRRSAGSATARASG